MDKFWNNGNPKLNFTKEQYSTIQILCHLLHILGVPNNPKGQFSIPVYYYQYFIMVLKKTFTNFRNFGVSLQC